MQTGKLGAVELRAHVTGNEVGAAIVVEKRDAHAALAVELPALRQALSEKHLSVEQVSLVQGSLTAPGGDRGSQPQQQNGGRGSQSGPSTQERARESSQTFSGPQTTFETNGIFDSQGRLSVLA